jgi:hypothetical protein
MPVTHDRERELAVAVKFDVLFSLTRSEGRKRRRERYISTGFQSTASRPWTPDEIRAIVAMNRPPDAILSKQLQRTISAIQAERCLYRKSHTSRPNPR